MLPEIPRGFLKQKYPVLPSYLLLSYLSGSLVSDDSATLLTLRFIYFFPYSFC